MRKTPFAAALLAALTLAAPAAASPNGIVISEFRVDGPTGGNDEFVEIRNTSAAPIAIGGYKLQGCAAASGAPSDRATVPANTTLPAGAAYLFTNSSGYTGAPAGNATYGTGLSNTGGLRIVAADGTEIDGVGSTDGAVDECREGAGLAIAGANGNFAFTRTQDTDDNAADFTGPSGTGTPERCDSCGGGPVEPQVTRIHAIQGPGAASPLTGQDVIIEGIVTGIDDEDGSNFERSFPADAGIWVQEEDAEADTDPRTSEGIFVSYVDTRLQLAPGTKVRITGRVVENFGETRIEERIGTEPTVLPGGGTVPAAVTIDPALAAGQDPAARAYYEQVEGMRVRLAEATAVSGGTNKFGELFLQPGVRTERVFRDTVAPDLIAADSDAGAGDPQNPLVDTDSTTEIPADLLDVVREIDGPLGFSFGNYKIVNQPAPAPQPVIEPSPAAPYPYEGVTPRGANQLRFASFNVENFFPVGGDVDRRLITQEEYEAKRDDIVAALRDRLERPDVIALQEVVDKAIADDVAAQLGGYTAYLEEGNDSRGIDVAFLVRDTVQASNLRQLGKDAPGPAGVDCSDVDGGLFDRPPLAIDIEARGVTFTAISNHFSSKAAPDACRAAQAVFVRDVVRDIEAAGGEAIVAGDLNSFEDEVALDVLEDGTTSLDNLWDREVPEERYSFQFEGRLQTLDHVLVTDGLSPRVSSTDYVHINNDYYDRRVATDGHDAADHDPILVTLELPEPPAPPRVLVRPIALKLGPLAVGVPGVFRAVDGGRLTYGYQWLRCTTREQETCAPIAGADEPVYLTRRADRGAYLRFQVTATGANGAAATATSNAIRG